MNKIFCAYSHKDEQLLNELKNHLVGLRRQGRVSAWHDRKISPGTEWEGQIHQHLNSAHIILLLVSSDFFASDYCIDVEMTRAMERHERLTKTGVHMHLVEEEKRPFLLNVHLPIGLPEGGRPGVSYSLREEMS